MKKCHYITMLIHDINWNLNTSTFNTNYRFVHTSSHMHTHIHTLHVYYTLTNKQYTNIDIYICTHHINWCIIWWSCWAILVSWCIWSWAAFRDGIQKVIIVIIKHIFYGILLSWALLTTLLWLLAKKFICRVYTEKGRVEKLFKLEGW